MSHRKGVATRVRSGESDGGAAAPPRGHRASWQRGRAVSALLPIGILVAGWIGWAAETPAPASSTRTNVPTVGMEGRLEVLLPGSLLEARPVDERSLIILRIADTFPHGALTRYDLRYVGLEPGKYDLREYLRRPDGSALGDLPPVPVEIAGLLPIVHTGQLIEPSHGALSLFGGYRQALLAAGVVWVVGLWVFWRLGRRRVPPPTVMAEAAAPTLAERMRPLIEQAAAGQLTAAGQAQLERMLISHWRDRLGLGDLDPAEAIARLRPHPEAGALLAALEDWLHRPPGVARVDVNALLAPYRQLEAPGPSVGNPTRR